MATIACQVTTCRFNARQRCTLSAVQIGSGDVAVSSPVLDAVVSSDAGQLRAGYASEFESYAEYANSQVSQILPGAICTTFNPL